MGMDSLAKGGEQVTWTPADRAEAWIADLGTDDPVAVQNALRTYVNTLMAEEGGLTSSDCELMKAIADLLTTGAWNGDDELLQFCGILRTVTNVAKQEGFIDADAAKAVKGALGLPKSE